jgi:hypothetical protein
VQPQNLLDPQRFGQIIYATEMRLRRESNAEDDPGAASGDPGSDGPTSECRIHALAVAIAVLATIVRFWVSHQTHALGEDALITLRYA